MTTYSFTVTQRFAAAPEDVLALGSEAARRSEWAGAPLSWGTGHILGLLLKKPFHDPSVRLTVTKSADGGGELAWACSFRTDAPAVGAAGTRLARVAITLLARRLATEADRRIAVTRRPSLPSRLQRTGLRLVVRPVLTQAPFEQRWIRVLREVTSRASRLTGSRRGTRRAAGAPVPGRWIGGPSDAPGLLVLHGGGYVAGSSDTHAAMARTLARLSATTAYVPDYRLAPEHRYPAALDDAEAAFRYLAAHVGGPGRVAIAGDSAGGGLALGLLDRLRRTGLQPAGLALISPWVDLTEPLGSDLSGSALDPLMPPAVAGDCRDAYAGDTPAEHPEISPARRPLDATSAPVAIVCGGDDFVAEDVRAFVDASTARGASIDLRVWPGMVHCFPVVAGTPEGASALAVLAAHIESTTGSRPARDGRHLPG